MSREFLWTGHPCLCASESFVKNLLILVMKTCLFNKQYWNSRGVDNGGARGAEAPPVL